MRSGQFWASGMAAGLILSVHPCTESNRHSLARLSLPGIAPDDALSQSRSPNKPRRRAPYPSEAIKLDKGAALRLRND